MKLFQQSCMHAMLGYGEVVYLCTPETYFIGGGFFSAFFWCAGLVRWCGNGARHFGTRRVILVSGSSRLTHFSDRIHQRAPVLHAYPPAHSHHSYRFDPSTQAVSFPLPFSAPTEGNPQATRFYCCSVPTASSQTWALTRRRRLQAGRLLMRSTRTRFSWRPSRLR